MILIIMNCILLLLTTAFNISKQCKIYEMTTVNCHCIGNEVNLYNTIRYYDQMKFKLRNFIFMKEFGVKIFFYRNFSYRKDIIMKM